MTYKITDSQCIKAEFNLPGYDLVIEKSKDKVLSKVNIELQSGKAFQAINSKYILLDNVLYFFTYQRLAQIWSLVLHSQASKERGN